MNRKRDIKKQIQVKINWKRETSKQKQLREELEKERPANKNK